MKAPKLFGTYCFFCGKASEPRPIGEAPKGWGKFNATEMHTPGAIAYTCPNCKDHHR